MCVCMYIYIYICTKTNVVSACLPVQAWQATWMRRCVRCEFGYIRMRCTCILILHDTCDILNYLKP